MKDLGLHVSLLSTAQKADILGTTLLDIFIFKSNVKIKCKQIKYNKQMC